MSLRLVQRFNNLIYHMEITIFLDGFLSKTSYRYPHWSRKVNPLTKHEDYNRLIQ